MEQEAAYFKALESVASFELRGDRLTLRTASGAIAVEYSLSESIGLSDTLLAVEPVLCWRRSGHLTPGWHGRSHANFTEDGKLSGSAGCNNYNASYQVDGDSLTIGPVASTKMACPEPPGVMDKKPPSWRSWRVRAAYQINVDTLILLDANGAHPG